MPHSKQAAGCVFPKRARVLLVDDVPQNRMLLALYCDELGLDHEAAENGLEAVEAASSGRFDLILMDILMPRLDGMAATVRIRDLPGAVSQTPIVAVTTAAAPGEVQRYLACGMNDVVAKPVERGRLAAAISAILARGDIDSAPLGGDRSAA